MSRHYEHIMAAITATPWAIRPEILQAMVSFVALRAQGGAADPILVEHLKAQNELFAARKHSAQTGAAGSVAVLPLYGVISQRASMMDSMCGPQGTSTEKFGAQFRQALNDPQVSGIVIDIDSPGGSVSGVDELASEVYEARGKKPIKAVSNSLSASAAYYIGSQADEYFVSPSSLTGSIGVYTAHHDVSAAMEKDGIKTTLISAGKYKVEGNSLSPIDSEALSAQQQMVNGYYSDFVKAVARGRKTSQTSVREGYGEGRVLRADDAVKAGLADRVGTLDDVLGTFGVSRGRSGARAEEETQRIAAEEEALRLAAEEEQRIAADRVRVRQRRTLVALA